MALLARGQIGIPARRHHTLGSLSPHTRPFWYAQYISNPLPPQRGMGKHRDRRDVPCLAIRDVGIQFGWRDPSPKRFTEFDRCCAYLIDFIVPAVPIAARYDFPGHPVLAPVAVMPRRLWHYRRLSS